MTDRTQPEALRLAEEITNLVCSSEAAAKTIAAAADELCRLHAENASLRAQQPASPPAEQQAQSCAVYAGLPDSVAWLAEYGGDVFTATQLLNFADRTHALRMQAAPKAAPVEQDDHQILAITTTYEQGVGKGHQAYNSGKEIANPYSPAYRCDLAWQYGYKEGKEQAQREAKAAPQQEAQEPATVPCQKLTDEIDPILSDPDTELSIGAKRALLWMRTWVNVPLYTAPQPAPAPLSDDDLVELGKSEKSGLHPWGVGTTRADYLRAVRAVLDAARKQGGA